VHDPLDEVPGRRSRLGLVRSLRSSLCVVVLLAGAGPAAAREQIRVVGSSTVYPFATTVAERFGRTSEFPTPVIESTGSGGGLKLFCAGVGDDTPDVANSSRRIKASEVELCASNDVREIVEIQIGYDGIVLANARSAPVYRLSTRDIFLALAREVPVEGKLVANPHLRWKDLDAALPDAKIEVLGPPPTSGTRDAFVELAMEQGAAQLPMLAELKARDEKAFQAVAHAIREDGAYVEAGENDNLIVRKLEANPSALGIFGFSYLDQNADRLHGSVVDGAPPEFERIASGEYSISRPLYFYVKKAHVGRVPGLAEYIAEFTSERAAGEDGYLVDKGLIPLGGDALRAVREAGARLEPLRL
jgi:phosphate transport system substrate-binding protein